MAYGLNANATKAVGSSDNGSELQAFVYTVGLNYTAGSMVGLNTLAGGNASEARAINLSGAIAGYSRIGTSASSDRAVIWNGLTPTLLTNISGGTTAHANGLSDSGTAVGWVTVGGNRQAFSYSGGSMSILALDNNQFELGGSEALSISGDGRYISGKAKSATNLGEVHGFLFDTLTNTTYDMVSSSNTIGWGVSNNFASGQEAGGQGFRFNNTTHASDGAVTPFGGTGISYDVNNVGEFVGTELDANGDPTCAWLSDGSTTVNLNDRISNPNAVLLSATGVAEYHQMVTGGANFGGNTHGYLLVPEPASCAVLAIGVLGLLVRRRKEAR